MTEPNESEKAISLEHIRLVGFGYIIAAAFNLFSFFESLKSYIYHGIFGLATFTDYAVNNNIKPNAFISTLMILLSCIPLWISMMQVIAFVRIKKRKSYIYCIFVSILSITSMPVGTLVGLASFFALLRRPTRILFDTPAA